MQDMRATTFKGKDITVKELTVKQVREVFERLDKESVLFIDDLIDQPVPAILVVEATGIPLAELEDSKPSDLIALCSEVLNVNPTSASMIRRRIEAASELKRIFLSVKSSTELSA